MGVFWGPLTECHWQNRVVMWRVRAAVDISDRGSEACAEYSEMLTSP